MDEFAKLFLAGILSGSVISTLVAYLLRRGEASRAWKEKSVTELLAPLYMQFDRTRRAFDRYQAQNFYLEAKILKEGNQTIRDLLLTKCALIPPQLRNDAFRLVEHYDRWLEEFERIRGGEHPDLNKPFVFVGTQGFPFPSDAETRFREVFSSMWGELYGGEQKTSTEA